MIRQAIEDRPGLDLSGQNEARSGMKRISDVAIACTLIILTLPLVAVVAAVIKLESAGPVLTREERRTCAGRRVQVLKFRTTAAPERDARGRLWQSQLTAVGRFLRYTRIADLPQLCNVVRGDMSLVDADGERPDFFD
jgi:lipopolysaccharide/colanic/teichoic acid biosynthesis glycosyltransferase